MSSHKNPVAKALRLLSDLASQANLSIELAQCHGAIITVAYALDEIRRRAVRPNDIAIVLAETVQIRLRLRHDWVETEVAQYLVEAAVPPAVRPDQFAPGVMLSLNTSAKVLALKLHLLASPLPSDSTDARDAAYLLEKISVTSPDQIERIYACVFPEEQFSAAARQLTERVFRSRATQRS